MKKVVLVTGTSGGLGRAFATAVTRAGFIVVGTVRRQEEILQVHAIQSGSSFARILDVTDEPTRISAAVEEIERNIGPVYALINNAGYGHEVSVRISPLAAEVSTGGRSAHG